MLKYPTPEEINSLPEHISKYIHDLESNCDPAGNLQKINELENNIECLKLKLKEIKGELY